MRLRVLLLIGLYSTYVQKIQLQASLSGENLHSLILYRNWVWEILWEVIFNLFFREVKRRLSLVIIAKFLRKRHVEIPDDSDGQVLLTCVVFVEFGSLENIYIACLCFMFQYCKPVFKNLTKWSINNFLLRWVLKVYLHMCNLHVLQLVLLYMPKH